METENQKRRTSDLPKVSVALKRLWHQFCTQDASLSLKEFARLNAKAETLASEWFNHKQGSLEKQASAARKKNKGPRIAIEAAASKAAKRKK